MLLLLTAYCLPLTVSPLTAYCFTAYRQSPCHRNVTHRSEVNPADSPDCPETGIGPENGDIRDPITVIVTAFDYQVLRRGIRGGRNGGSRG